MYLDTLWYLFLPRIVEGLRPSSVFTVAVVSGSMSGCIQKPRGVDEGDESSD